MYATLYWVHHTGSRVASFHIVLVPEKFSPGVQSIQVYKNTTKKCPWGLGYMAVWRKCCNNTACFARLYILNIPYLGRMIRMICMIYFQCNSS